LLAIDRGFENCAKFCKPNVEKRIIYHDKIIGSIMLSSSTPSCNATNTVKQEIQVQQEQFNKVRVKQEDTQNNNLTAAQLLISHEIQATRSETLNIPRNILDNLLTTPILSDNPLFNPNSTSGTAPPNDTNFASNSFKKLAFTISPAVKPPDLPRFPASRLSCLDFLFDWDKFRYCRVYLMRDIRRGEREKLKFQLNLMQAAVVESSEALCRPIPGFKTHSSVALIISEGLKRPSFHPLYQQILLELGAKIKQSSTQGTRLPTIYIYQQAVVHILWQFFQKINEKNSNTNMDSLPRPLPRELVAELNESNHFIWNSNQLSQQQIELLCTHAQALSDSSN
jgi:hypothetical protein